MCDVSKIYNLIKKKNRVRKKKKANKIKGIKIINKTEKENVERKTE